MPRVFALGALLSLLAVTGAANAAKETRKSLIIMDLVAERGLDPGLQRLLNELILSEFSRAGLLQVTGGSDLQAVISNEEKKQLIGCDDAACIAEVGGALGADFLAVASVGRVGDFYLLNIKVIASGSAEVAARNTKQVEATENALVGAVRDGVADIIRTMTPEAKAPLATEVKLSATTVKPQVAETPASAKPGVAVTPPSGEPAAEVDGGASVLPWIVAGVGVLAAGAGTGFGLMARSELKYAPVDPRYAAAKDTADSRALVSTVSWGVAGAAIVAAGILFTLDALSGDAADLTPSVSSEGAAVLLRF